MRKPKQSNNQSSDAVQRVEGILFLQKILHELSVQLDAVREEGSWTLRQRYSLWKRCLGYKYAAWRLNGWVRRINDPDAIKIPSRHGLVFHAIEKPDVTSALDSLAQRGEFTCCLVPGVGKSQRRQIYQDARKRGFDVRLEKRCTELLIERLPS